MRDDRLRDLEHAVKVDGEDPVPLFGAEFVKGLSVVRSDVYAGVVDKDVYSAEIVFDLIRDPCRAFRIGHVEIVRLCLAARLADSRRGLFRIGKHDIADGNRGTVCTENRCHRRADGSSRSGHEHRFAAKI